MATDTGRSVEGELSFRPAAAEDLPEIAELYIATRRAAVPAMPAPVHDDDDIREWVSRLPATKEIWLAEDAGPFEGTVLGFAVLDGPWLDSLYVGEQYQARGIGAGLLDVVKSLRPDGFGLWVFASNTGARGFYHRHGLVELEHTDGTANEERSPDVRMAWPGTDPVGYLRTQIDDLDDEIALLLARRFALTASVQGFKTTPGRPGRDPQRERAIAERMAAHAPGLGASAIGRIMDAVISESLDAYESTAGDRPALRPGSRAAGEPGPPAER